MENLNNARTGALIAERRRALGLTQEALAGRLHVTGQGCFQMGAWAQLSGGRSARAAGRGAGRHSDGAAGRRDCQRRRWSRPPEAVAVGELTAAQRTRRRAWLVVDSLGMLLVAALVIAFFVNYGPIIFRRENPVPALAAAVQLSGEQIYAEGENGVYIA